MEGGQSSAGESGYGARVSRVSGKDSLSDFGRKESGLGGDANMSCGARSSIELVASLELVDVAARLDSILPTIGLSRRELVIGGQSLFVVDVS
jgi:hypothetical protein